MKEAAINDLIWQVPLTALFAVFAVCFVLSPYWIYQRKNEEINSLKKQNVSDLRSSDSKWRSVLRKASDEISIHRAKHPQYIKHHWLPAIFSAGAHELDSNAELERLCKEIAKQSEHPFWAFDKPPFKVKPEDRLEFLRQMRTSGRTIKSLTNICDFCYKDWQGADGEVPSTPI